MLLCQIPSNLICVQMLRVH